MRLVFIVEGDTELVLVNKLIIPYLYTKVNAIDIKGQTIITNRKQHKKGSVGSYGKFKNEIERTFAQGNVMITTLIDFYKLPTDFPAYSPDANMIPTIEEAVLKDIGHEGRFLPYIQKHELEALMFSDIEGFELVVDDPEALKQIEEIIETYPNPEDINNSEETAPSRRMKKIFGYDKVADSDSIFEMIGLDTILEKCPRFAEWIGKIEKMLGVSN